MKSRIPPDHDVGLRGEEFEVCTDCEKRLGMYGYMIDGWYYCHACAKQKLLDMGTDPQDLKADLQWCRETLDRIDIF